VWGAVEQQPPASISMTGVMCVQTIMMLNFMAGLIGPIFNTWRGLNSWDQINEEAYARELFRNFVV